MTTFAAALREKPGECDNGAKTGEWLKEIIFPKMFVSLKISITFAAALRKELGTENFEIN